MTLSFTLNVRYKFYLSSCFLQLEDKVMDWQSSPASTLNSWFSFVPNWSELVLPALQYLTGVSRGEAVVFFLLLLLSKPSHFFKAESEQLLGAHPKFNKC